MRLIDADRTGDVFLELMNLPKDYAGPSDVMISIDAVFSVLGQVPSVDTVRKNGWWIKKNSIGSAVCSVCGGVIYNAYDKSANKFCHMCGAAMQEVKNGEV